MPTSPLAFRVWHKTRQRYVTCSNATDDLDDLVIGLDGRLHFCDEGNGPRDLTRPSDYVVERFTGLTDKNGKDIYENDIVTVKEEDYRHERDSGADSEGYIWKRVQVIWASCGFRLRLNQYRSDEEMHFAEWIEVVGNVHETPELLTR